MMQKKQSIFIILAVILLCGMSLVLFLLSKHSFTISLPKKAAPTPTPTHVAITWNPNTKSKFPSSQIGEVTSAITGYYSFHGAYFLTVIHIDKIQNWANVVTEALDKNNKPLLAGADHVYIYTKSGTWFETDITKNDFCSLIKTAPASFANTQEASTICSQKHTVASITVPPTTLSQNQSQSR